MAIWQYNFFIVPVTVGFRTEKLIQRDEDNLFDESVFWEKADVKIKEFDQIADFLPITRSWSKDILMFGSEDSHRFEILCCEGRVISVSFRVDYRIQYDLFLSSILEFCLLTGFKVLDQDLCIISNLVEAKSKIENSPQFETYMKLDGRLGIGY
jgi:hypothetical protein